MQYDQSLYGTIGQCSDTGEQTHKKRDRNL